MLHVYIALQFYTILSKYYVYCAIFFVVVVVIYKKISIKAVPWYSKTEEKKMPDFVASFCILNSGFQISNTNNVRGNK